MAVTIVSRIARNFSRGTEQWLLSRYEQYRKATSEGSSDCNMRFHTPRACASASVPAGSRDSISARSGRRNLVSLRILIFVPVEYVGNNGISYNVFFTKFNNAHLAKSTEPVNSINKSVFTTEYLHVSLFCVANQTDF